MDKRIPQPIEEQELTTKASVWQWGKDRARLPFCKCSQKSPKKKPKGASDWPLCFHWGLHSQATSQRKISSCGWSPAPFRFQVQSKIQSTGKRVHKEWHSWLVQTWLKKSNWWSCIRRPIIPAVQAEWLEYAVVYRARHTFLRGALLGYNGSGWQWS